MAVLVCATYSSYCNRVEETLTHEMHETVFSRNLFAHHPQESKKGDGINLICLCYFSSRKRYSYLIVFLGVLVVALALIKPVVNAFILISVSIPAVVLMFRELRE